MEGRTKRRSSFFRRDLEPEDESMSTTASETLGSEQTSNKPLNEEIIKKYIKDLKDEQKAWSAESNQVKQQYKTLRENKSNIVKSSKSQLYAMLTEEEKRQYSILFSKENYASLLESIETLKKKVAIVSVNYENNYHQVEQQLHNSCQAQFENLMNQIVQRHDTSEDLAYESGGDSISDFLDSENESNVSDGMDMD
ncbi:hypothetical protein M8J76_016601 [Diaphorina citri]|nr:hypothetical protein M8J76_016601 [Diaphorina citri]